MKQPPYRGGSWRDVKLRDRLIVYFTLNDEQLTLEDVCVKFSTNRSTAQQSLMNMRRAGLVEACNVHDTRTPMLIGRGPELRNLLA